MNDESKYRNYILGLDLGIASVGWAVVEVDENEHPQGLIDVGVRAFERAEVSTGESLALARRLARASRRLVHRRSLRLLKAKRLLKRYGVLSASDFDGNGNVYPLKLDHKTIWDIRVEGLNRILSAKEWAAVLLHLIKRRGYLSQRKSESKTNEKELGALLSNVQSNHSILANQEYRTAAELAIKKFQQEKGHIRNQRGDYSHTFSRLDVLAELDLLFDCQRKWGNNYGSAELQAEIQNLLMFQKPSISGEAILKMLGKCTFETEYKAAKACYSSERFIWLTKLNNLRILELGQERVLTESERNLLIDQPYQKTKLTYKQVRKLLSLDDTAIFKGINYSKESAENTVLMEMKAFHSIRLCLEKNGLKTEWQGLATKPELLDAIGTAFSLYKTDKDITQYLSGKVASNVLDVLLDHLNFSQFIQLSLQCLGKILPFMEQGQSYDEARRLVYGNHDGKSDKKESLFLPVIPADDVRNPVVLRALSQARKVINGIVRLYGSPARVHIETARELGKSYEVRKMIERQQEESREQKERAVKQFKELFPFFMEEPQYKDILKMRLYDEQHGKCLYSGKAIDSLRLIEKGYVEVDHVLPLSRTWDDSRNNKVLVLANENQNKANQTPYEWLGGKENSEAWRLFVSRVKNSNFSSQKKQLLLTPELNDEAFKAKNLNDTRYISHFLCNFIEEYMFLKGKGKKRVFASKGRITAFLRQHWGIKKSRELNNRHHAIDAIIVACSTASMLQKITTYFQRKQEMKLYVNKEFPAPWKFFRKEIDIRVFSDHPVEDLEKRLSERPEANHSFVQPLFVSRAPNRKVTGQGHKETIKSAKRFIEEYIGVLKKPLEQLKLKDLEKMVNREREKELYNALKQRLEEANDNPAKAFSIPFYKKGGQQVKSIRIEETQNSGVLVRGGIADNGSMVRADLFLKQNKYFLVPIYTWQVEKGILPNTAVVAHKNECEWEEMDEGATFLYSIYPNDLLEVITKKEKFLGYYVGLDRFNGSISLKVHDMDTRKGKEGVYRIGIKQAKSVRKYQVDELGKNIRPCRVSKRQGFQIGRKSNK